MLASGQWKPDSDDAYFIDLNPKQFDRVMDYLRTGELSFEGLRPDQAKMLKKTLDYLQLGPTEPAYPPVSWDPQMCCKGFRLSQQSRVVKSGTKAASVRSVEPCVRYSVRVDSGGDEYYKMLDVMIGFAPQAGFKPNAYGLYTICGWYIRGYEGSLISQDDAQSRPYGKKIAAGSVLMCILDRMSNSISVEVDGQSCGVVFTNIPQGDIYAALCFVGSPNIQLTLVD